MNELKTLAEKHKIEDALFHSSNLAKIYKLIGEKWQHQFLKQIIDQKKSKKDIWLAIIDFLNKELRVKEEELLLKSSDKKKPKEAEFHPKTFNSHRDGTQKPVCSFCGQDDHVVTISEKGKSIVNYFACKTFVDMNPKQRFEELKRKNSCFQCLNPGLKRSHKGFCFNKYICPDESHKRFPTGIHVLACDRHKNDKRNIDLLEDYKLKHIINSKIPYKDFTKKISISFHVDREGGNSFKVSGENKEDESLDTALFLLQTIQIEGKRYAFRFVC